MKEQINRYLEHADDALDDANILISISQDQTTH